MIAIRLPWRHRARPSATLHEIQSAPKGKLVSTMLHSQLGFVNRQIELGNREGALLTTVAQPHLAGQFSGGCSQPLYQDQRQRPVEAAGEPGKSFHDFS